VSSLIKNRYLFVCSANKHRSRTAEHLFKRLNAGNFYEFKSCGTYVGWILENRKPYGLAEGSIPISLELVEWADIILCMEDEHSDEIEYKFGKEVRKKCYVLNIKDIYQYGSPELEAILMEKVKFGLKRR
jgi:predicted protein tyrosine phosphatase